LAAAQPDSDFAPRQPPKGLSAVPLASRGRSVAHQFVHLQRVRIGWLKYHASGKRPKLPSSDRQKVPDPIKLKVNLVE
jgi:hypothetical protein